MVCDDYLVVTVGISKYSMLSPRTYPRKITRKRTLQNAHVQKKNAEAIKLRSQSKKIKELHISIQLLKQRQQLVFTDKMDLLRASVSKNKH